MRVENAQKWDSSSQIYIYNTYIYIYIIYAQQVEND